MGDRTPVPGLGGNEFQGRPVDAVAQACGHWAVFEDMPLVATTPGAMDFRAGHKQFEISSRFDHSGIDRLPEAGPTCAAVVLVLGREQR